MVAHVGDFGLVRLLHGAIDSFSKDQSNSAVIKGSVGYVAPEYGMGGKVSPQGDVYIYGILLLEMVTGKRLTDDMFKDGINLHNFTEMALREQAREIADSFLLREFEESANNVGNGRDVECKSGSAWFPLLELELQVLWNCLMKKNEHQRCYQRIACD